MYNLASGRNVRNAEIEGVLRPETGCRITYEANAPLVSFPRISIDRLRAEFDFTPTDLLSELPKLIHEYRAYIHEPH